MEFENAEVSNFGNQERRGNNIGYATPVLEHHRCLNSVDNPEHGYVFKRSIISTKKRNHHVRNYSNLAL